MDKKKPQSSSTPPAFTPEVVAYESEPPTNTAATMPRPTPSLRIRKVSRKKWFKFMLTGIIVLTIIGGALAYNLWYQNPQKVITDGFAQAIAAKSMGYTAAFKAVGDNAAEISVDGNAADGLQSGNATLSFTSAGKSYAVKGAVVLDKANNVYFKLTNVAELVKPYRAALSKNGQAALDQLTAKLGGDWIKLSAADMKNYDNGLATAQQCMVAAITSLQTDKAAARELASVYKEHQFITIDKYLGGKNGSLGYQISTNKVVGQAFTHDFQATAVYKALHQCNPQLSPTSVTDLFNSTSGQTTLYVSRFTHHITSLVVASKDVKAKTSSTFTIAPKFNVPVSIQVPTKTTTIAQLLSDLQGVLQSASKP